MNPVFVSLLHAVDFRISGGSEYLWTCFGPNAWALDFGSISGSGSNGHIVFDTKTQAVYEVELWVNDGEEVFRYLAPEFANSYSTEAQRQNVNLAVAFDDVPIVDLSLEEMLDCLRKEIHTTS